MKVDIERVRKIFSLYTSLSPAECARWDVLCGKAAALVESRLREGAESLENRDRLAAAAALWACGDYMAISPAAGGGEFKVGDITVKQPASQSGLSGARLKEQALADIGDLLVCAGFVFKAISEPESAAAAMGPAQ